MYWKQWQKKLITLLLWGTPTVSLYRNPQWTGVLGPPKIYTSFDSKFSWTFSSYVPALPPQKRQTSGTGMFRKSARKKQKQKTRGSSSRVVQTGGLPSILVKAWFGRPWEEKNTNAEKQQTTFSSNTSNFFWLQKRGSIRFVVPTKPAL